MENRKKKKKPTFFRLSEAFLVFENSLQILGSSELYFPHLLPITSFLLSPNIM